MVTIGATSSCVCRPSLLQPILVYGSQPLRPPLRLRSGGFGQMNSWGCARQVAQNASCQSGAHPASVKAGAGAKAFRAILVFVLPAHAQAILTGNNAAQLAALHAPSVNAGTLVALAYHESRLHPSCILCVTRTTGRSGAWTSCSSCHPPLGITPRSPSISRAASSCRSSGASWPGTAGQKGPARRTPLSTPNRKRRPKPRRTCSLRTDAPRAAVASLARWDAP